MERLHSISGVDAVAEGVYSAPDFKLMHYGGYRKATEAYKEHWNAAQKHSWGSNPWVSVTEFKRIDKLKGKNK